MAEYSTAVVEEQVAVISDSEGDEEEDGIVEIFDDGTLPPEVWANIINCEYCISINYNIPSCSC